MRKRILCFDQWLAITALALMLAAVVAFRFWAKGRAPGEPTRAVVVVEVCGEVRTPGVYWLDAGEPTVARALKAAGGLSGGRGCRAALPEDWTAMRLRTGQTVSFRLEEGRGVTVETRRMAGEKRLALGLKLDPNLDSPEALALIPWLTEKIAAAIVARREQQPWESIEELQEVSGVGSKTIEEWRDYLEVGESPP